VKCLRPPRPPEPVPLPTPTIRDQEQEAAWIRRRKSPAARVYAKALLEWWDRAPSARGLTDAEAHRVFLLCRRLAEQRRGVTLHRPAAALDA
jgi:hypothetical protein